MTDRRSDSRSDDALGLRLLAEDRFRRTASGSPFTRDSQALLEDLLDRELLIERQIRQVAMWAWISLIVLVPLAGLMRYLKYTDVELIAEMAHHGLLVMLALAAIALFLALLMTIAWLLRLRSLSLAVVERRLANIESHLQRER